MPKDAVADFNSGLILSESFRISAQETALAVGKGMVDARIPQIGIGTDMQLPDQVQIIIQHPDKILAFLSCLPA